MRFLNFSGMSENPKSIANLRDGWALMPWPSLWRIGSVRWGKANSKTAFIVMITEQIILEDVAADVRDD